MASLEFKLKLTEGVRADRAISDDLSIKYPALSKNEIKRWFKENRVSEKKEIGLKLLQSQHEMRPGLHDIVIEGVSENELTYARAAPSNAGSFLPVIYEDESILILNKISGIPSLPQSASETETAVGSALAYAPALSGIGIHPLEPGLLHRLDTATSGILAFAKTQTEYDRLRALWKFGAVKKIYRARVSAPHPRLPLIIETKLAHDIHSKKKMIAVTKSGLKFRGKALDAHTVIAKAHAALDLEIEITTGVMHQIRCHLASQKLPILGDELYKGEKSSRLWLHSWKLELPALNGAKIEIVSQLPEGWIT